MLHPSVLVKRHDVGSLLGRQADGDWIRRQAQATSPLFQPSTTSILCHSSTNVYSAGHMFRMTCLRVPPNPKGAELDVSWKAPSLSSKWQRCGAKNLVWSVSNSTPCHTGLPAFQLNRVLGSVSSMEGLDLKS